MSIRIHELAKKLNMDNKDLMALLKERGYPAKSVSSTVDNITAEALEQELAAKNPAPAPVPVPVPVSVPVPEAPATPEAPKIKFPAGVFVKSAQDIVREKEEAAMSAAAARAASTPPMAPAATTCFARSMEGTASAVGSCEASSNTTRSKSRAPGFK